MNNYVILGLKMGATIPEIKKAYKALALIHHPDRPNGNSVLFIKITTAYKELLAGNTGGVNPFGSTSARSAAYQSRGFGYYTGQQQAYTQQESIPNGKYEIVIGKYDENGNYVVTMTVSNIERIYIIEGFVTSLNWNVPANMSRVSITIDVMTLETFHYKIPLTFVGVNKKKLTKSYDIKREADVLRGRTSKPTEGKKYSWFEEFKNNKKV